MRAIGRLLPLAFGALGIVYGDIGTSPLYAFRESFEHADLAVSQANAYGVASVVFWALIVIISIKYLLLVMRADNHGEGGILALTALLMPAARAASRHQTRHHRARRVRHGPAVRGWSDHAGHLGVERGRGIRGGDDGVRSRG